jgi:hypothetical protein
MLLTLTPEAALHTVFPVGLPPVGLGGALSHPVVTGDLPEVILTHLPAWKGLRAAYVFQVFFSISLCSRRFRALVKAQWRRLCMEVIISQQHP